MTFDHDFDYSFPLLSSLLNREEEKENELAKIVIKGYDFLLDHCLLDKSTAFLKKVVLFAF